MSQKLNVVAVSGSVTSPSRTTNLLTAILDSLAQKLEIDVHLIVVGEIAPKFAGVLTREELPAEVEEELKRIEEADLLVVGSPVYRASFTGLFKHLFDFVDQYALVDTPVLLAATGGSDRHALIIEHQFRPLFGFFQALALPLGVYASHSDFTRYEVSSVDVRERIDLAIARALPLIRSSRAEADRIANQGASEVAAQAEPPAIAASTAVARLDDGATLVDVRSLAGRESSGTIPTATLVDKTRVAEFAAATDPATEIIVFCGSVVGSGPVVRELGERGFTNVTHVDGGFQALQDAGVPTLAPSATLAPAAAVV